MFYRKMGKLNEEISLLGLGAMRLPTNSEGRIDQAASIAMIRKATAVANLIRILIIRGRD